MSVTGHNHDESGAPTYPDYRDRCPVGCDDLTPVRMADTNVQYVGKDPGGFAHNPLYIIQVLYDSLKDIGYDTARMTRP